MIDTLELLDDVAFAKAMLAKKSLSNADLVFSLRNLLRMKYYPVAVKFFFSQKSSMPLRRTLNTRSPHIPSLSAITWQRRVSGAISCSVRKKD